MSDNATLLTGILIGAAGTILLLLLAAVWYFSPRK